MRRSVSALVFVLLCARGAVAAPGWVHCDGVQQSTSDAALTEAMRLADGANRYMTQKLDTDPNPYLAWFGARDPERVETVRRNVRAIRDALGADLIFDCADTLGSCTTTNAGVTGAYVDPDAAEHTIYLCERFWEKPLMTNAGSQPGWLIHEMSHFKNVARTEDLRYLYPECQRLAGQLPDQAITNASNYMYFAESRPDVGCACEVGGHRATGSATSAALLLVLAVARRRLRRSRHVALFAACCALVLLGGCGIHAKPRQFPPIGTETRLACELRAPAEVKVGSPVPLTFGLRNLTKEPIRFLTWLTPFEGWLGNILRVTRDGQKVEYHGVMASRLPPPPNSFFTVVRGVELSVTLDVSHAYPMDVPGHYVIEFYGYLLDTYALSEERGHESTAVKMPCKPAIVDVR